MRIATLLLLLVAGCRPSPDEAKAAFEAELAKSDALVAERHELYERHADEEAIDDVNRRMGEQLIELRKALRAVREAR